MQSIPLITTQHDSNANRTDKRTSRDANRKHALHNDKPTDIGVGRVMGSSSPDGTGPGRKSGRLREKGPTTYTAKGEIIRGGKRMNDELHDQPFAKRVRYET